MRNFYDSTRSERQLKSLTGLGKQEFEKLLIAFSENLKEISDEEYRKNRKKRSRRPGGGRKGQLPTPALRARESRRRGRVVPGS